MKTTTFRVGMFLHTVIGVNTSFAIVGELLPPEKHLQSVCALKASEWKQELISSRGVVLKTETLKDYPYCSAVQISESQFLSAAHCNPEEISGTPQVNPINGDRIQITFKGSITMECPSGKSSSEVSQFISNPMFHTDPVMTHTNADKYFDLSVIQTQKAIPFKKEFLISLDEAQNVEIAKYNIQNKKCRSFGYGITNDGSSGKLNAAITPVNAIGTRNAISDLEPIEEGGARSKGGKTAPGDSGGALVCENAQGQDVLIGIISRGIRSFGVGSDRVTDNSVYALPSFNKNFIQKAIQSLPNTLSTKQVSDLIKLETQIQLIRAQKMMNQYSKELKKKQVFKEFKKAYSEFEKKLRSSDLNESAYLEIYDSLYYIERESVRIGRNYL